MDCSPPSFSVCRDSPGKNTVVGGHALLQGIFPTQGLNPVLSHCRWILYCLSHQGSPRILEWVDHPFSRGTSQPRNWTRVSCIAGGFFTSCAGSWWNLMECFCCVYIQPMLVIQPWFHKWNCISICSFPNTFTVIKSDMSSVQLCLTFARIKPTKLRSFHVITKRNTFLSFICIIISSVTFLNLAKKTVDKTSNRTLICVCQWCKQQRMRWSDGITTQRTWVWVSSGRWWWTGKPGMLQSTGMQRVGHNWVTELNWNTPTVADRNLPVRHHWLWVRKTHTVAQH